MKVYLDHAATTYTIEEVFEEMKPYFKDIFGNASSQHSYGQAAQHAIDKAREQVASALGAQPNEIYFTSGGTESDNWAIKGLAAARKLRGKHIISSVIEHHAVLHALSQLEKEGYEVTYLPINKGGEVDLEALKSAIRPDTVLITIMTANNEIGTLQPIKQIAEIAKAKGVVVHTDAVQAIGSVKINVKELGVDMLSLSAHKFYGPKGIGALYVRNGIKLEKLITGGSQERSMRGGTYNTPSIVGMGKAIELAIRNMDENVQHVRELRDYFLERAGKEIPDIIINGAVGEKRLPNNANISFKYIEGESLLLRLDLEGIAVSSGSACSSGSLDPSHVLLATGLDIGIAHGSLRFSFGKCNDREQVDYVMEKLKKAVESLRLLSPLYQLKGEIYNV